MQYQSLRQPLRICAGSYIFLFLKLSNNDSMSLNIESEAKVSAPRMHTWQDDFLEIQAKVTW